MSDKEKKKGLFGTIGSLGSAFVVGLCPVCIPAIGAFLSSIGLGFLVQETVLEPVLIVFLLIAVAGLLWSYFKEHHKIGPFILGSAMAISMYIGRYIYFDSTLNVVLMYGSIPGIIGATLWNLKLRKSAACAAC